MEKLQQVKLSRVEYCKAKAFPLQMYKIATEMIPASAYKATLQNITWLL